MLNVQGKNVTYSRSQNKVPIAYRMEKRNYNSAKVLNQQFLRLVITYIHQLVFIYPNQWLLDLEHEPKQLEASPPQQSGLQLESASLISK